jgi:L-alanine-DL-glutamate epimerase-like enolase superfamily enzyme
VELKVESVDSYPLRVKLDERLQGGTFAYTDYQTVLVRAVCDGVEGWGEAMSRSDPRINSLAVSYLASEMVGHEFDGAKSAWMKVWNQLRVRGHTRGPFVEALSGIETSLFDCAGRLANKPLGRLFTESSAGEVRVFAGSLFESRGPLKAQVELARTAGLSGAKVKVGFGVERDLQILGEVREAWEEGMLVADANGAYDGATAEKACAAYSKLGLSWFEEPVLSDDLEGYRRLAGSGVRIGAGESWFAGDFDVPVREGLVDVLEPSVSRCGGVGVMMKVAADAESSGMGFSPMTGMNSAISVAASLQVASVNSNEGVEFNPFPNPLQSELAHGLPAPKGGYVHVPGGPGLGVEVDLRFVKAHTLQAK